MQYVFTTVIIIIYIAYKTYRISSHACEYGHMKVDSACIELNGTHSICTCIP